MAPPLSPDTQTPSLIIMSTYSLDDMGRLKLDDLYEHSSTGSVWPLRWLCADITLEVTMGADCCSLRLFRPLFTLMRVDPREAELFVCCCGTSFAVDVSSWKPRDQIEMTPL